MKHKVFKVKTSIAEHSVSYFAGNLKYLRANKFLTQDNLADQIGIKRSSLASYEEERAEPDLITFSRICKIFGVSMEEMITKDFRKQS